MKHLNTIDFDKLGSNTDALATQLRVTATNLDSLLSETRAGVRQMDLPEVSRNAGALITQMQAALRQLDGELAAIDTTGINETLASVRRASAQLEETLRELKQYPSGFFFGSPPPPAKSVKPARP